MFIRSKFEKMAERKREFEIQQVNPPVNIALVFSPVKNDLITSASKQFYIGFMGLDSQSMWAYDSEKDRDQEYEWILQQLGCKVNGKPEQCPPQPPDPVIRPPS